MENGVTRISLNTILTSVASALLLASIFGLLAMYQKVALQEERHSIASRINEIQSANIQALQAQMTEYIRTIELLRERQGINIKAVESLQNSMNTLLLSNTEQQYLLNSHAERLRSLEGRLRAESP